MMEKSRNVISSFCRDIDEVCLLRGYYMALSSSSVLTFRDNLSVPFAGIKKSKKKGGQNEENILNINIYVLYT
jgi:hypothetical protein